MLIRMLPVAANQKVVLVVNQDVVFYTKITPQQTDDTAV